MRKVLSAAQVIMFGLLGHACDSQPGGRDPIVVGSQAQAGTEVLTAALSVSGACVRAGASSWSYVVNAADGEHVTARRILGIPNRLIVSMNDANGNMAQGWIDTERQAVVWFDLREHKGKGRIIENGGAIAYPPVTWARAQAEWSTPRGQQLALLARRASAACDSTL